MTSDGSKSKGEGHRQRLRDRFLAHGADGLTDSDMLELLLTMGTPRRDCKEPARELLARFNNSLSRVLDASQQELEQVKGVGSKNAFAIHFVQAVARRYLRERLIGKEYLRSSREVGDYLLHAMRGLSRETLVAILLDASYGILALEEIATGTLTAASVHPRELVKTAMAHNAAAVILAHNHPSGNTNPSEQDRRLTRHLYLALALCEIQLLDHCVVGADQRPYSFADHGLMEEIRQHCRPILSGTG
ncbi:RadC family protein [Desulfurivibrio alkaliphilus]|uniref:DNA repair protein RadC n=1 Tax=Desulfurivibrio alkaliphilus (strain DSM 19089 / UNIQEM U267 / AHT2) TaxID=589865 RepID=D6Z510_DESAT|nr:DNA repair protein RadC [Desulfurivibrio alkaliphilus]ADH86635.1 DNA repair protein RadC [Desulfurivibrio alkaliphilus AHT 2]